jgi:hypothetical protein
MLLQQFDSFVSGKVHKVLVDCSVFQPVFDLMSHAMIFFLGYV